MPSGDKRDGRGFNDSRAPVPTYTRHPRVAAETRLRDPAAQCVRIVQKLPPKEGVGNAGCPLHPQPRVQCVGSTRVSSPRSHRDHGIPAAMVLTVYLALPRRSGFLVTVISRKLACARLGRHASARLDAGVEASGPHGFTVREQHRSSSCRGSLTGENPPCDPVARPTLLRPPHPVPYVRDDRDTPLRGDGTAQLIRVIWVSGEPEYFCKGDWTRKSKALR